MDLDKLRSDFMAVRTWLTKCGEWTADEANEVGAGIAKAVNDGEVGELVFWSDWMARFAAMAKANEDHLRKLEIEAAAWLAERKEGKAA